MEITLNVEVREGKSTKKDLSSLRRDARIPAVVYGGAKPPLHVSLSEKELADARRKGGINAVLRLKHAKGEETVVVKELQRHPVTDKPVHADFLRILMTQKIDARVPLAIVGEAPGVKDFGGLLAHDLRELRIKSLPGSIPQSIPVDVSGLGLHQSLRVKDLRVPEGVDVLDEPEHVVVHVTIAKVEEVAAPAAAAPAEGAAAAEPESSSTKGKKDEEGKLVKEQAKPAPAAAGDKKEPAKKEGK